MIQNTKRETIGKMTSIELQSHENADTRDAVIKDTQKKAFDSVQSVSRETTVVSAQYLSQIKPSVG